MTSFLYMHKIRIFDYTRFAEPLRERIRTKAHSLASQAGITIEHVAKAHIRKEDLVAAVLKKRGYHPGLVHIISAMEACESYEPWHNKLNHKLRKLGIIKKISGTYRYYLTKIGRSVIAACCRLTEQTIVPALA